MKVLKMIEKTFLVEDLLSKNAPLLSETISLSPYAKNRFLNDEDVYALVSSEDCEINDEDALCKIEDDGYIFSFFENCEDIAKSIMKGTSIGFASLDNNIVFIFKKKKVEMWSISFDYEYTDAELLGTFKSLKDISSIIDELEILSRYETEIFSNEMSSGFIDNIIDSLKGFFENEVVKDKKITLTKEELDELIKKEVDKKLSILETEMEIDKIENPKIVEKEVTVYVTEEVEVVKEVVVNKCDNPYGMYT